MFDRINNITVFTRGVDSWGQTSNPIIY